MCWIVRSYVFLLVFLWSKDAVPAQLTSRKNVMATTQVYNFCVVREGLLNVNVNFLIFLCDLNQVYILHNCLSWDYVLSNGPNWTDFSITSIFGVIFWSKVGYLTPGVPIYRAASNCHSIYIEDIAARFNLNAFLWYLCVI